jgi:deoxyribose-phosphate aldolase
VASVAAGFPAGLAPFELRVKEIDYAIEMGAQEIDVVISRRHALLSDWPALYREVRAFREACGPIPLKVILETGELAHQRQV